jgi:hypothetical protein
MKQKARLDWIYLKKVTIKIEEKNPKKIIAEVLICDKAYVYKALYRNMFLQFWWTFVKPYITNSIEFQKLNMLS